MAGPATREEPPVWTDPAGIPPDVTKSMAMLLFVGIYLPQGMRRKKGKPALPVES